MDFKPSKPLTYESQKSVLMYMEANLRLNFARRCPQIQKTEKLVPLRMDSLEFNHMNFKINETQYKIGVHRKYHNPTKQIRVYQRHPRLNPEEPSDMAIEVNKNGGLDCDIDEKGFKTMSNDVRGPGDIHIFFQRPRELKKPPEEVLDFYTNQLEWAEKWIREQPFGVVRNTLLLSQEELLPFRYMEKNILPPYDRYLQLTVKKPRTPESIERVEYTRKVHEAFQYFTHLFFGNRKDPIQLRLSKLVSDDTVIRLPKEVKFKIRELNAFMNISMVYEALKPIIVESSYPLDILECKAINWTREWNWDQEHYVVQSAKILNINLYCFCCGFNQPYSCEIWTRSKVNFTFWDKSGENSWFLIFFVKSWLQTGREIGDCYTFGNFRLYRVRFAMEDFERDYDGEFVKEMVDCEDEEDRQFKKENQILKFRMSAASELQLSCEPCPIDIWAERFWILKMEVVAVDVQWTSAVEMETKNSVENAAKVEVITVDESNHEGTLEKPVARLEAVEIVDDVTLRDPVKPEEAGEPGDAVDLVAEAMEPPDEPTSTVVTVEESVPSRSFLCIPANFRCFSNSVEPGIERHT